MVTLLALVEKRLMPICYANDWRATNADREEVGAGC